MFNTLKTIVNGIFDFFSIRFVYLYYKKNRYKKYHHSFIRSGASYSPWMGEFKSYYDAVKKHTLLDIYRLYELYLLRTNQKNMNGCVIEVGCYKGGSSAILGYANKEINYTGDFYVCDTFKGVVKSSHEYDKNYSDGEHSETSVDIVKDLFNKNNLLQPTLLQGIFPDQNSEIIQKSIAFLHIDVDTYNSAKDIFMWAKDRLEKNAIVIFDDYGFHTTEGVTTFCNELKSDDDFYFIYNMNGHGIFIKKN